MWTPRIIYRSIWWKESQPGDHELKCKPRQVACKCAHENVALWEEQQIQKSRFRYILSILKTPSQISPVHMPEYAHQYVAIPHDQQIQFSVFCHNLLLEDFPISTHIYWKAPRTFSFLTQAAGMIEKTSSHPVVTTSPKQAHRTMTEPLRNNDIQSKMQERQYQQSLQRNTSEPPKSRSYGADILTRLANTSKREKQSRKQKTILKYKTAKILGAVTRARLLNWKGAAMEQGTAKSSVPWRSQDFRRSETRETNLPRKALAPNSESSRLNMALPSPRQSPPHRPLLGRSCERHTLAASLWSAPSTKRMECTERWGRLVLSSRYEE